jgi:predicted membrane protein
MDIHPGGLLLIYCIEALPFIALVLLLVLLVRDLLTKRFHKSTKIVLGTVLFLFLALKLFSRAI